MNTIKGENLMIFVKEGDLFGNASTALIPFALATTCSLNVNVDAFDVSSKDSGSWAASLPGIKSWSLSTANLYSPYADMLLAVQINRVKLKLYWMASANTESNNEVTHTPALNVDGNTYKVYSGDAWIDSFSATADNNAASNYTVNFTGTGALTPSNSLPSGGLGVSKALISLSATNAEFEDIICTGASGAITATPSTADIKAVVTNNVVRISVNTETPTGPYVVTLEDTGHHIAYVYVTVTT